MAGNLQTRGGLKAARLSNRKVGREEFAAIRGESNEKTVRKVQKIDNRDDKKLAKKYGVRYKG